MKKILRFLIMHLPIISSIYNRYCNIIKQLANQSKSIKELKAADKKQKESIKKLSQKLKKKDEQIKKLSDSNKKLRETLKKSLEAQKTANAGQFDNLNTKINSVKSFSDAQATKNKTDFEKLNKDILATDEKIRQEKIRAEKQCDQLSREIVRNHTLMKNAEKALKDRINYKYIQGLHKDDYKRALTEWLFESTGEIGDLDNPRTFNEKIQWLKLHSEEEIYAILADKYRVRDWIKEKIGEEYLVPLIGAWDNFDDINFDEFPEKFVLKANHGCRYNYIVYDKSTFNVNDARNKFAKWMRENFAWNSLELQYTNIPRKIIAEEYIENSEQNLNDYKIFCFDGKPKYIMYVTDRMESIKSAFFDLDWNLMPFVFNFPQYTGEVEKPAQLEKMIELAGILAEGFPHVRVDFYLLNDGSIKFGEMTFTTSSGFCRWQPAEYNRILGDMIPLPIENQ